jgi:VanZ family protein
MHCNFRPKTGRKAIEATIVEDSRPGWPALAYALTADLLDESLQHFTPGRAFQLADLRLDLTASTLGALAWLGLNRVMKQIC